MKLSSYFLLSFLLAVGNIAHAVIAYEQFYPAVIHLSSDKVSRVIIYNFAFSLFLLFALGTLRLFVGTLRDLEVEQLIDTGRGFLADTILFLIFYSPTIDGEEVDTVYLAQFICRIIFMKAFHLIVQIRVSHMFEVGLPRHWVNIKLSILMVILLIYDVVSLRIYFSVATRDSTFYTWIVFEAQIMLVMLIATFCKYFIHLIDMRLDNGWPAKSVYLFYVDLIGDVANMMLFLIFMMTFFFQNPTRLPVYMLADVIQVARQLAMKLKAFRRYRAITSNMDQKFPNATAEELEAADSCIICRDSLWEGSKKLPCTHVFHLECLKSWVVMQQCCPTCRADIPADPKPVIMPGGTGTPEAAAAAEARAAAAAAGGAAPPPALGIPPGAPGAAAVAIPPAYAAAGYPPALQPLLNADGTPWAPNHVAAAGAGAGAPPTLGTAGNERNIYTAYAAGPDFTADPSYVYAQLLNTPPVPGEESVQDIITASKHCHEMANYMREQQKFWMNQVSRISKEMEKSTGATGSAFPGFPAPPGMMGFGVFVAPQDINTSLIPPFPPSLDQLLAHNKTSSVVEPSKSTPVETTIPASTREAPSGKSPDICPPASQKGTDTAPDAPTSGATISSGSSSAIPTAERKKKGPEEDVWDELERLATDENGVHKSDKNPEESSGQAEGGNNQSIDSLRETQRRKWEAAKSKSEGL